MSDCDQFIPGSREREICDGVSGLPRFRENLFRARNGIKPLPDEVIVYVAATNEGTTARIVQRTALARKPCAACGKKPKPPAGPRKILSQNRTTKPSRIKRTSHPAKPSLLSRAMQYAQAMARHVADDATPTSPADFAFRESCCGSCPQNVDSTCVLCSCPLKANAFNDGKLSWRSESCPVGKWFRQTDAAVPLVDPIRNLVFHIYPRHGCEWNWHRHVQHIIDNESIWTGKRVISIGTGNGLASPETVKRQFRGVRVDNWVVLPNKQTVGETEPFFESVKLIASQNANEVTFLAHTKGITHPQDSKESLWSEMMWETCLDLPSVDDALRSHACVGPFKRHMKLLKSSWHYSGHFGWINHARVFGSPGWENIVQQRAGMEAWLGAFIANGDAACIFHDNPPIGFLHTDYWENHVIPEFESWKAARC